MTLLSEVNLADSFLSGVAVGSSIGHAIGGFFGGGSSTAAAEPHQAESNLASQTSDAGYQGNSWGTRNCDADAKSFTKCLDENGGNMQICGWYLDQLVGYTAYGQVLFAQKLMTSRKRAKRLRAITDIFRSVRTYNIGVINPRQREHVGCI